MMYVRFPLSLRQVEDLLHERGVDISHETVHAWWNRFGPRFAAEIKKRRVHHRLFSNWRWHLDEVFVRINGELHYLWRAVDHEGEVLESFVTRRRNRKAALTFLRKAMKRYGCPKIVVTDRLRSYRAAMKVIGNAELNRPRFTGERLVQILGCFFMCVQGFIEHLLCFVRRDISDGAVKTLGVVPIDPFQRFPFKLAH